MFLDGVKQFQCPICKHLYPSPRLLVEHIQNNHKKGEKAEPTKKVEPDVRLEEKGNPVSQITQAHIASTESPRDALNNRNKANVGSDDEGSDTSADESDEEEKPVKGTKQSFPCSYCKDPKTIFVSR